MRKYLLATLSVVGLADCAGASMRPPASTAQTQASGAPSMDPQSPNSLPPGSQVQAPFTPAEGNISSTQVGPGGGRAPVSSTMQPIAGTGTATVTGRPNRVPNSY